VKNRWALFLIALAIFIVSTCTAAAAQPGPEKPNILFVLADDMRADELQRIERFDRLLIQRGVTFENAFVSNSVCCPSRTTALTGRYAHNHGVTTNIGTTFDEHLEVGVYDSTLPSWLQKAGYRTGHFGKYINGFNGTSPPPGFDVYQDEGPGAKDPQLGETAAAFVKQNHEQAPLFVNLWVKSPHEPLEAPKAFAGAHRWADLSIPPSFNEKHMNDKPAWARDLSPLSEEKQQEILSNEATRLDMLEGAALALKHVLDALEQTGELDNTYIVFSSDNGYMLGEHRIPKGKAIPYEESVRVPLVMAGPGIPANVKRDELVVNNDIAPTIAQWAGVKTPEVDGRSLAPLLSESAPNYWRTALLSEHPGYTGVPGHALLITHNVRYIEWATGERELYQRGDDPYQLENAIHQADSDTVASLSSRLHALEACAGETCLEAEGYAPLEAGPPVDGHWLAQRIISDVYRDLNRRFQEYGWPLSKFHFGS
jgi:N-acetylglucosamine-6-sulfatase